MQKVLFLTLKKRWFDMIAAGEKLEEYRDLKPFFETRLKNRHYDVVIFQNGYSPTSSRLTVEYKGVKIKTGKEQWGAVKGKLYFALQLGSVISRTN